MTLPIKYIHKMSLIDYPPYAVSTLFLGGCNFRCPYCHNKDLVLNPEQMDNLEEAEVLGYLALRKKWIDGICVTGGEPLLNDLTAFLSRVRHLGLQVKLDTNGAFPDLLERLVHEGLVDFIAMDIKAPPAKYQAVTGSRIEVSQVAASVACIRVSGLPHEFRTTLVPDMLDDEDFREIGIWLRGADQFSLQQFRPHDCLDRHLATQLPWLPQKVEEIQRMMSAYISNVAIKGI